MQRIRWLEGNSGILINNLEFLYIFLAPENRNANKALYTWHLISEYSKRLLLKFEK